MEMEGRYLRGRHLVTEVTVTVRLHVASTPVLPETQWGVLAVEEENVLWNVI